MTRGIFIKVSLATAGVLSLAGCVATGTPERAAELFDCAELDQAVASAANGFDDIKGRFNDTRLTRSWDTDVQAFDNACVITSSKRPDHYVCFGRIQTEAPRGALAVGGDGLGQCLGSDWNATSADDRILFKRPGTEAVVTLETFVNDRGHRMGALSVFQKEADAAPLPSESSASERPGTP